MTFDHVLSFTEPSPGDRVITQGSYAQFSEEYDGWVGSLVSEGFNNTSFYQMNFSNEDEMVHVGFIIEPLDTPIDIVSGWNWIGYTPQFNLDVNIALETLEADSGDVIKGQLEFAHYVEGLGWWGNLDRMFPGQGYMLKTNNVGTLVYPDEANTMIAKTSEQSEQPETPWEFNPRQYRYSMTLTGVLKDYITEEEASSYAFMIFSGDEIRGTALETYVPVIEEKLVFLMIHSNEPVGEVLSVSILDMDEGITYQSNEEIIFSSNDMMGTPTDPFILTRSPLQEGDFGYVPDVFSLKQNFPNPFNPISTLQYGLPDNAHVSLIIYDMLGKEITQLVNTTQEAGFRSVQWDATDSMGRPVSAGVYLYQIQAGEFVQTKKMVLLK
jgi:hypothetical protein